MTIPTLTQPAFLEWQRNHFTEEEQVPVLEFLSGLEGDSKFLELLHYFNLESYTYSINDDETICWHNFSFEIMATELTHAQVYKIIQELQDDNQPVPAYSYYIGSLYLTIIGLA